MRRLADLPLLGVVFVCITWVLLCMFVPLLWTIIEMRRQMARLERTGGVEAMAVQVDGLSCFCRRSYFVSRGCLRVIAPVAERRAGRCDSTASERRRFSEVRRTRREPGDVGNATSPGSAPSRRGRCPKVSMRPRLERGVWVREPGDARGEPCGWRQGG